MIRQFAALTFFAVLVACTASAQSEFGRGSGGEIQGITKSHRGFSGSLGFGLGSRNAFEGTVGGSLANERLWFFASASHIAGIDASATAQPVDWTSFIATLRDPRNIAIDTTATSPVTLPSSFLSLRSTSILSDRTMLNISVSRSTASPGN